MVPPYGPPGSPGGSMKDPLRGPVRPLGPGPLRDPSLPRRGSRILFSHTFPPLQVAPNFACSCVSLRHFTLLVRQFTPVRPMLTPESDSVAILRHFQALVRSGPSYAKLRHFSSQKVSRVNFKIFICFWRVSFFCSFFFRDFFRVLSKSPIIL